MATPQAVEKTPISSPCTYLVGADGSPLVKIGYTSADPKKRLAKLQTGQPFQLTLLHSWEGDYERALHSRFAEYRVRGEWFDLTPLGDPVEAVQAALDEIISSGEDAEASIPSQPDSDDNPWADMLRVVGPWPRRRP